MRLFGKRQKTALALAAAVTALGAPQAALAQQGSLSMSGYAYPSALSFSITGHSSVGAERLAVWEIGSETGATGYAQLDLDNGSFQAPSGNRTARGTADNWLHALGNGGSGDHTLTALVGANNQDQVMATPIPEPETYAMLLAGLGLMGFVVRHRRARDSA